MNIWLKSTVLLLLTLFIGFALGWYSSTAWEKHKREKFFAEMRANRDKGERFSIPKKMINLIQPTEAQKDTVDAIVQKYHEKFIAKSVGDFEFVKTMFDSLFLELKPVLTKEQYSRLEDRRQFFKPGFGPGPDGAGGPPSDKDFRDSPFNPPLDGNFPQKPGETPPGGERPKGNWEKPPQQL